MKNTMTSCHIYLLILASCPIQYLGRAKECICLNSSIANRLPDSDLSDAAVVTNPEDHIDRTQCTEDSNNQSAYQSGSDSVPGQVM
jgi:hypothetical protein